MSAAAPKATRWAGSRSNVAQRLTLPSELLSLAERSRYLGVLRLVLVAIVVVASAAWPDLLSVSMRAVVLATAAYLSVSAIPAVFEARSRGVVLPILQGSLLVDGIYLVAVIAVTGGAESPLRFLLAAHLVAVTLLCSYRTGLKLAVWHTVVFLLAVQAIASGLLPGIVETPGGDGSAASLAVVSLWAAALCTATFAAASERELRRQKVDLASLSAMVARFEARPDAADIPSILLEQLCASFGFTRGVVLAGSDGELEVAASTVPVDRQRAPGRRAQDPAAGPLLTHAWSDRAPQLVKQLDAETDPLLAASLPGARNVLVVPMFLEGGRCVGVVALERGGSVDGVRRWVLSMIEQFVAHATLALENAWLTEERDAQLTTIRELERELRSHNAELEHKVAERTVELSETIQMLQETDEQRRHLLDHVVRVAEEERRRIANDIHDDPVQKMVALKMQLELIAKAHPDVPELERGKAAVLGAIHSLRHLLFDLRPPILDEGGLGEALRYLLDNAQLPFEWSVIDGLEAEPSTQTRVIAYRIAQEAVANARKHSRAEHLQIKLDDREGGVWMEVADDGVGFLPQDAIVVAPGHLGLAAMRERAEMAGGRCILRSLPGDGTTLEVWMPLGTDAEDQAERTPQADAPRWSRARAS